MKKVHIVTDSVSQIPASLCSELDIHVVPLPYVWDDVSYLDNVDMGPRQFYSRLRNSDTIPKTSGPTPRAFQETFEKLTAGGNTILAIHVARFFSSTLDAAKLARNQVGDADITILDSGLNSMGLGFLVIAAARAAKQGMDVDGILEVVARVKETTGVVFAVKDIRYLRRGGRISFIGGYFGSALNLIPIMELRGGPIQPVTRIRTDKKLITKLLDLVSNRITEIRPLRLAVVHADIEDKAWELRNAAQDRFKPDELLISEVTPVLGIHTGPDALGLAYSSCI